MNSSTMRADYMVPVTVKQLQCVSATVTAVAGSQLLWSLRQCNDPSALTVRAQSALLLIANLALGQYLELLTTVRQPVT
jgi:hypothetical protein